jgi:hypothetical protein
MKKRSRSPLALVALLFLSSSIGWGQVGSDIALQGQAGNWVQFIPNAQVTVCTSSALPVGNTCAPLATVYTDQTLGTPLAQPVLADATGNYTVFAAGGIYFVCVVNPNVTPNTHYCKLVQIGLSGNFAPINSPAFTGIPTAPTAAPGTNSTQIATTAFVAANVATGSLAISQAAAPATLNLTSQGTNDWFITTGVALGSSQPSTTDATFYWKKSGVGLMHKSFVFYYSSGSVQPGASASQTGGPLSFTATQADTAYAAGASVVTPPPTAFHPYIQTSASPTAGGGYGFQFQVPSNGASRTLRLYLAVQGILNPGSATVTAHLMDGSATDAVTTLTDSGTGGIGTAYEVDVTYKSANGTWMTINAELTSVNIGALSFLGCTIQ